LSGSSYTVGEGDGSATITVVRTVGSTGTVGVSYSVTSGTATAGSDFTAVSGTVSFGNGEVSKVFTVPITDDAADEPDEAANITLSSPTGGALLGSPSSATLTIVDNDEPPQPQTIRVTSSVSLQYLPGPNRFRGRVFALNAPTSATTTMCRNSRQVTLRRNGSPAGSTFTSVLGKWRLNGFPNPQGTYTAVVLRAVFQLSNGDRLICRKATSGPLFL
jgi:hypothetical protein